MGPEADRRARLARDSDIRVCRVNMEMVSILREIYGAVQSVGRYSQVWRSHCAGEGKLEVID